MILYDHDQGPGGMAFCLSRLHVCLAVAMDDESAVHPCNTAGGLHHG